MRRASCMIVMPLFVRMSAPPPKSPPAQKPRPLPVSTAARTSVSACTSRKMDISSECMAPFTAFNRSGRLRRRTATPSVFSITIVSYFSCWSMPGNLLGVAQNHKRDRSRRFRRLCDYWVERFQTAFAPASVTATESLPVN